MPKLTCFPDGTPIDPWFSDTAGEWEGGSGGCFRIHDYGISADGTIQTGKLQALIDSVSGQGGGTIVIPEGTYLTTVIDVSVHMSIVLAHRG